LSEQLRRYLDDKAWLENRRIMQLIRGVEQTALALRDGAPEGAFMTLDEPAPDLDLAMARPLFTPPLKPRIDQHPLDDAETVPADALFAHVHVDHGRLAAHVRQALQNRPQISLAELVDRNPLEQGLAELVAYFSLAADDRGAIIDDAQRQTLTWADDTGRLRQATMPLVIFCRVAPATAETPATVP
jgi:hypothetical protein